MSDQDLVVQTVRDILAGHEPFVLTADRRWDAGLWGALAEAQLHAPGYTLRGGTNVILRGIVARGLGLR